MTGDAKIYCLNTYTNCTDPARDLEYNRWYSHTHLPDLSHAEGFLSARRFVNLAAGPNEARYWAQYEFKTISPNAAMLSFMQTALKAYELGRHIDCIAPATASGGAFWQWIDPASLTPLNESEMAYPTTPPEAIRHAIEARIAASR